MVVMIRLVLSNAGGHYRKAEHWKSHARSYHELCVGPVTEIAGIRGKKILGENGGRWKALGRAGREAKMPACARLEAFKSLRFAGDLKQTTRSAPSVAAYFLRAGAGLRVGFFSKSTFVALVPRRNFIPNSWLTDVPFR